MSDFPEGSLIMVEFEFRLPAAANGEQVDEWVSFELGNGTMRGDNPLCDHDLEFWQNAPELTDTGLRGRIEDSGHKVNADGSASYRRRYVRERRP